MKRFMCIFLTALFLCGCSQNKETYKSPIEFYYTIRYSREDPESGLIRSETREGFGYENALDAIMALYLQGPESTTMQAPFPEGTKLISINQEGNTVYIQLSGAYSSISGYRLTFANICIAQTVFGLTDAQKVNISVQDGQLDNQESITIDKEQLIFEDIVGAAVG